MKIYEHLSDIPFWFHDQVVYLSCTYPIPNVASFPSLMTVSFVWSQPLGNDQYHSQLLLTNEYQLYLTVSFYLPKYNLSEYV